MFYSKNKEIKNKDFLVIGAGRFGTSVAKTLTSLNKDVLLVDKDSKKLQEIKDDVTHTIITDATDESCLKSLDVSSFDTVIVGIGRNLNTSILVTLLLKEMGAKQIICKAISDLQAKTLYKLGATKVIFPERDTGARIANSLVSKNAFDSMDIDSTYSLFEITAPNKWVGKEIYDLKLEEKHKARLVAIKSNNTQTIDLPNNQKIQEGDLLILLSEKSKIQEIL